MRRLNAALGAWLFAVLMPVSAWAQSAGISVPDIFLGEGDEGSNQLLNMIFGPLFPGPNDQTIISTLITNFNVLFLAFGMALHVYNMIVAVTQTAHDGDIFGKRSSTLWAPIRTVRGGRHADPAPRPATTASSIWRHIR